MHNAAALQQYRRFQVAFLTESAATTFIDSIRFICPCKANTGPPARMPRPNPVQGNAMLQSQASMTTHTTMSVARPSVTMRQTISAMNVDEPTLPSLPPASVRRHNTMLPVSHSSISHSNWGYVGGAGPTISQEHRAVTTNSTKARAPSPITDYDASRPSSAVTFSSAVAHHSSSGPSSDPQALLCDDRTRTIPPTTPSQSQSQRRRKEMLAQSSFSSDVDTSLPSSSMSMPASSPPRALPRSPDLMPPPPVPPQASLPHSSQTMQTPPSSAPNPKSGPDAVSVDRASADTNVPRSATLLQADIAAALRDNAGLYELSKSQLESLVAEVVREEGFKGLVSFVDMF